jgi:hypothetical protein
MEVSDVVNPVEESDIASASEHLRKIPPVEDHDAAFSSTSRANPPQFQYSPLSSSSDIRLIILEPGIGDEPVRCQLVHISLDENPSYEALSYTWGDASVQGPRILLDGKPFQVTVNLGAALLYLRDEASDDPKERILWIDAICINQTDI